MIFSTVQFFAETSSQEFVADRVLEAHMFSTLDRQLADRVVVDHLWNARERLTELAEDVADRPGVRSFRRDLHVHEAAAASAGNLQHTSDTLLPPGVCTAY